jgi:apolipoprotein D and lipocalin family protein
MKKAALVIAATVMAAPAWAMPAAPTKAVPVSFFSGRWYEIARTPNNQQKDCEAPTYQFAPKTSDTLSFTMTCHKGEPEGKPLSVNVTLHLPSDEARNRFRVTALGGMASLDYWVLDRADDGDWWILATPKNPRVWLLSRKANVDAADKSEALARIRALGFDPAKLEFPKQA